MADSNGLVTMLLRCTNLENQENFSKSDPFLKFSRLREDGSYVPCFKTEVKMNNLNPVYQEIKGTTAQLANGDLLRPMRVECFDWNKSGNHTLIGQAETSLTQLSQLALSKGSVPLVNPKKTSAGYKNSGLLNCDLFKLTPQPSFVEYIKGGTEISFIGKF